MKKLEGQDVANISWCDANLISFEWDNNGRDLILNWARNKKPIGVLTCTWVRELKINIVMGENAGGNPLVWNAEMKGISGTKWILSFDFAAQGVIEFTCNEIFLTVES